MASHALGDGGIPPRDATKKGLTRVMTLSGAYGTRNYTVKGLRDQKGKRVLVESQTSSGDGYPRHIHQRGACQCAL